jgi:hypothetical protein
VARFVAAAGASGGDVVRHASVARGQRGAKAQPSAAADSVGMAAPRGRYGPGSASSS